MEPVHVFPVIPSAAIGVSTLRVIMPIAVSAAIYVLMELSAKVGPVSARQEVLPSVTESASDLNLTIKTAVNVAKNVHWVRSVMTGSVSVPMEVWPRLTAVENASISDLIPITAADAIINVPRGISVT